MKLLSLIFILCAFLFENTLSQNNPVDSLRRLLVNAKHDSIKIRLRYEIGEQSMLFRESFWDSILVDTKNHHLIKIQAKTLHNLAYIAQQKGQNDLALKYYFECIPLKEKARDESGVAYTYINVGSLYLNLGDIKQALDYFNKSLTLFEKLKDSDGLINSFNNLASVYKDQADYSKALEYSKKTLVLSEKLNNRNGIARALSNIGNIYFLAGDPDCKSHKDTCLKIGRQKSFDYLMRSKKIYEEIGEIYGVAYSLNTLAYLYTSQGDPYCKGNTDFCYQSSQDKAIELLKESLSIHRKMEDPRGESFSLSDLGQVYLNKNNLTEASQFANEGLNLALKIDYPKGVINASQILVKIYEKQGKGMEALKMLRLYTQMRDSINNLETQKTSIKSQMQYEFEKKELLSKVEQDKKDAIANEEKNKQRIVLYSISSGLAMVLLFFVLLFNRFKAEKKQKKIIEHQKEMVEEKNQEILDSIIYAKRLQDAILPPHKLVKQHLENSFILYKPKDIVAGDFYWMELALVAEAPEAPKQDRSAISGTSTSSVIDTILFAAADCTGHGVPGAMVSVVCSNALNRTVKEFGITEPGKVLDKVTDLVIETFEKSEADVKDGMDISLVSLAYRKESEKGERKAILKWAGANNPLWIVRENRTPSLPSRQTGGAEKSETKDFSTSPALPSGRLETTTQKNQSDTSRASVTDSSQFSLQEIKADKQPIGKYSDRNPFTTNTVELCEGDSIYIFTDGYADQFGGEKGKKFKSSKMKELILSIQNETMEKQKELINEAFENWKGNLEQVDDVCIIGVRI